ncbi:hypothetical protein J1N35_040846 [Gossypium stocksii]|uniref:Uncharacterized protein n=1 Tax=Gossypium stocksii TaxID=47602 RepID=A0A9D3ZIW6_9ROSI|nr:hypothetical protein J1N35_040846 [Gossypium stocksii]
MKMMYEISKLLPPRKEDMSDAHNSGHENPCITDDHEYGGIHTELVTEDHGNELNIVELLSDPIYIAARLTIKVEVEDEETTNVELKLILNESVE